jgi:hypothetical protein
MRCQRLAQMSTGVLLITLSAGCSSGSKPNPAPASSGSPTVATTEPTTQPTGGSGPVVTLTSKEGYVYKLQASPYTGPTITVLDYTNGGGTGNAPPGKVFGAIAVTISDGVADRPEPLAPLFNTDYGGLTLAVPANSAAAFGSVVIPCNQDSQSSTAWCDVDTMPAQATSRPGEFGRFASSTAQLEPGQPVSLLVASVYPMPQAAPMAKLTLFSNLSGRHLVQVPVSTSG